MKSLGAEDLFHALSANTTRVFKNVKKKSLVNSSELSSKRKGKPGVLHRLCFVLSQLRLASMKSFAFLHLCGRK